MKKSRWNTDKVVKLLESIPDAMIGKVKVTRSGPGGDVDTDNLVIKCANSRTRLFVCGFVTDFDSMANPSDNDVEMVEVKDGEDSDGGLTADDDESALLYARVRRALRKAGFITVRRLDAYF